MFLVLETLSYLLVLSFLVSLYIFNRFAQLPLIMQSAGLVGGCLIWGISSLLQKRCLYRHYPWNIPVIGFNLFLWIACSWSFDPAQSIRYTLVFTTGSVWLIILSSYPFQKKHLMFLLGCLFLAAFWQGIALMIPRMPAYLKAFSYGILHGDAILFRTLGLHGLKSSVGGSNSVGGLYTVLLTLLLPLSVFGFTWRKEDSWKKKVGMLAIKCLFIMGMVIFSGVILMSGSRGSYIGAILAVLFIILSRQTWVVSTFFLLIGTVSSFIPTIRLGMKALYSGLVDQFRYTIWQNSWEITKLVPLTGVGLGNFKPVYYFLFQENYWHAHNIFINVLVELGFPGLIGFLWVAGALIYYGLQQVNTQPDRFWKNLELGLTATVFGYLMRCLVDYTI